MNYEKEEYAQYRLTTARALLALASLDSSKHSGIISLFNQYFVKTGKVDKKLGRLLKEAKDLRENGDYGDFSVISREIAEKQLENARLFVNKIEDVISNP